MHESAPLWLIRRSLSDGSYGWSFADKEHASNEYLYYDASVIDPAVAPPLFAADGESWACASLGLLPLPSITVSGGAGVEPAAKPEEDVAKLLEAHKAETEASLAPLPICWLHVAIHPDSSHDDEAPTPIPTLTLSGAAGAAEEAASRGGGGAAQELSEPPGDRGRDRQQHGGPLRPDRPLSPMLG